MNISEANVGVSSVSWDGALVQVEEAPDRQQKSEENCNENQAKGCQSHKVRYETLMGPCCSGGEVWRSWRGHGTPGLISLSLNTNAEPAKFWVVGKDV